MDIEQERIAIIQTINQIRTELGMEPYSDESLGQLDNDRLKALYHQHMEANEKRSQALKEAKPQSRLNMKLFLVGLVPIIAVFSILFYMQLAQPEPAFKKNVPAIPDQEFFFNFAHTDGQDAVFSLSNNGKSDIASFDVSVDGSQISHNITSGQLPLKTGENLYFKVSGICDGAGYSVEVYSGGLIKGVTLTTECSMGSLPGQ